jgi:hypothetical protein
VNALKAVTLDTIANWALVELFQTELSRVLDNIADINTDPAQKRTITIAVELKPGAKRESADVKVKCSSKLAGILTVNTQFFLGKQAGKLVAVENDPRQGGLFDQPAEPKPLAAVSDINSKKGSVN